MESIGKRALKIFAKLSFVFFAFRTSLWIMKLVGGLSTVHEFLNLIGLHEIVDTIDSFFLDIILFFYEFAKMSLEV